MYSLQVLSKKMMIPNLLPNLLPNLIRLFSLSLRSKKTKQLHKTFPKNDENDAIPNYSLEKLFSRLFFGRRQRMI